jgi:hypothetical protein
MTRAIVARRPARRKRAAAARRCLPTLADLVDELAINQIKQVLLPDGQARFGERMAMLVHDLDVVLGARAPRLSARLVRILVVLAQMNLHIWTLKERAQQDEARYMDHLKLAHQLNGLRNRMKNALLDAAGDGDPAVRKSNCDLDGLAGWDVRID